MLTKLFKPGDHVQVDLKKLVKSHSFVSLYKLCYIKQDSGLQVTIPAGDHGEVSKHLSRTIAEVRKPPISRYDTYFNPSELFSSIQAKWVYQYEICT